VASNHALSRDDFKAKQSQDKYCTALKVGKEKGTSEYFADQDGLIYRRRMNREHHLVVPTGMAREVISLHHSPVFIAHPGKTQTLELLCRAFYWPAMRKDVESYVQTCSQCQLFKQEHESITPAGDGLKPAGALEVTKMKILGPFITTENKNEYLLAFVDKSTPYAEVIPILEVTPKGCAFEYAMHIVSRYGDGLKLISDQDEDFNSEFIRETCKVLGVKQLFTTIHHSRSKRQSEAWIESLWEELTHFVNAGGNRWDILIPYYLMWYRSSLHGSTTGSPLYKLYGKKVDVPYLHEFRAKLSTEARNSDHAARFENRKLSFRKTHNKARERPNQVHGANTRDPDRSEKGDTFNPGEYVLLDSPAVRVG
jgi:hypothetical protein